MFLLEYLKHETYETLGIRYGLNDLLFTVPFEGPEISAEQIAALEWLARNDYDVSALRYRRAIDPAPFIDHVRRVRNEAVPRFLEDCLREVNRTRPTMVGFTCMFDQTIASLAMAKVIRERHPDLLIVMGGYALEAPVGSHIARTFPFVDVVVQGEAEGRIVALAEASLDRSRLRNIDGIDYRNDRGELVSNPKAGATFNLDDSPFPDYDDFFRDVEELKSKHSVHIDVRTLPVESSRGCWWGQVHHCVFCGIDDDTMRFRFKSAENVEHMLKHLSGKYGIERFRFADYILPRAYYRTLLPRLAADPRKYRLHWEMKSNVTAAEVALMKQAGVDEVQPGIESFSTPVLARMKKGVTGLQNVLTVRLLTEHDIVVNYNILFGFPDDTPDDYRHLVRTIPLLYHLPPPFSHAPVETTRYAPMQADAARFGIGGKVVPSKAYETVFSPAFRRRIGFDLDQYAYTFKRPYEFDPDCAELYDVLVYQILHWIRQPTEHFVELSYQFSENGVRYRDSRFKPTARVTEFGEDHARVQQLLSDRVHSPERLKADLPDLSVERLARVLEELEEARVILREGRLLVGLALSAGYYERLKARADPSSQAPTPALVGTTTPTSPRFQ